MTKYKRTIKTTTTTVVIETHFDKLYLGVDNEPAKVIPDQAFYDAQYLWSLVAEKINVDDIKEDYIIITTSTVEYKVKQASWGSSILYRQLSSKHYKVAYNYIVYSAVSVIGWFEFLRKEGV